MSMSAFITGNMETLLSDWEQFAASLLPAGNQFSRAQLRDFGKEVLETVAHDIDARQSSVEQAQRARTENQGHPPDVTESARKHAADRLHEGFTLTQLVDEYRALRANVTRRWAAQLHHVDQEALHELTRFNEALDQSMFDAIAWYSERLQETRDLFTGVLAHDLRNPLGAMLLSAEALLLADDLESQHTKAAARIRRSGERMQRMIGDLLDFTRSRLGTGLRIAPQSTDLGQVCRLVVDEMQAYHPDQDFELDPAGDLKGRWDTARLQQMLGNLIANAVAFARPETPVVLTVRGEGETVRLAVHNQGPAIPDEARNSLFDPLSRVGGHREQRAGPADGLGLGLFVAQQIAQAHGGAIEVHSTETDGTTFTATLPRQGPVHEGAVAPI